MPAVAHHVAVVAGVDDDGVLIEALFLQQRLHPSDDVVDAGEHAEVGSHVGFVFLGRVPTPEEPATAEPVFLQERRHRFAVLFVAQSRSGYFDVFIHAVGRLGPLEVEPGAPVAVFGVRGVETDRQAEGRVGRRRLDELDGRVAAEVGFVTLAAVGHLFQVGVAVDRLVEVEEVVAAYFVETHAVLPGETGSITGGFQ